MDDPEVGRNWLTQMGHGAALAGIDIQYCMTLPREVLQSVETTSVTRVRASEDYLLSVVGYFPKPKILQILIIKCSIPFLGRINGVWASQA